MNQPETLRIMTIDCCEHTIDALKKVPSSHLIAASPADKEQLGEYGDISLIVIGLAQFPVRRLFISHLRHIYPDVPLAILRREVVCPGEAEECIRGEFLLSDQNHNNACEIVNTLRKTFPLKPCPHLHRGHNYDTVREVIRVIALKYSDPALDLQHVAKEVPISAKRLSRILNQQVGVSFRQLLRDMRIEEAKRMLISRRYSVKEVAARVGFSDCHYFSRSFKEITGQSASEFRSYSALLS